MIHGSDFRDSNPFPAGTVDCGTHDTLLGAIISCTVRESLGPAVQFGISFIVLQGERRNHGHCEDTYGIPSSFDTSGIWNRWPGIPCVVSLVDAASVDPHPLIPDLVYLLTGIQNLLVS